MQSFCFAYLSFAFLSPSCHRCHLIIILLHLFVIIDYCIFLFSGEYIAQFKFTLLLMPNGTSR